MEPALHYHHCHAIKLAKEKSATEEDAMYHEVSAEPADMSSNSGLREARDLGVGEDVGVLGKVGEAAYVGVWC